MKVSIRKTEYARKAPGFAVWVTDEAGVELFLAHPQSNESTARVVAAAMGSLVKTQAGRALVLAAVGELG